MAKLGECKVCGVNDIVTEHHRIKRGQQSALIKCKDNLIDLCTKCHYEIHHGKNGHALDLQLQWGFQNHLEDVFDKNEFTREEIKKCLGINEDAIVRLCKTIKQQNSVFLREDVIRACMGGKLISKDDIF